MAHCPPEMLEDIADVLAEVRGWPGIVEKTPGVFYVRREPFLHFHLVVGGRRRADIKGGADWRQVHLPHPLAATKRRAFLKELRAWYGRRARAR